jgi:hypothetical protein
MAQLRLRFMQDDARAAEIKESSSEIPEVSSAAFLLAGVELEDQQ